MLLLQPYTCRGIHDSLPLKQLDFDYSNSHLSQHLSIFWDLLSTLQYEYDSTCLHLTPHMFQRQYRSIQEGRCGFLFRILEYRQKPQRLLLLESSAFNSRSLSNLLSRPSSDLCWYKNVSLSFPECNLAPSCFTVLPWPCANGVLKKQN